MKRLLTIACWLALAGNLFAQGGVIGGSGRIGGGGVMGAAAASAPSIDNTCNSGNPVLAASLHTIKWRNQ